MVDVLPVRAPAAAAEHADRPDRSPTKHLRSEDEPGADGRARSRRDLLVLAVLSLLLVVVGLQQAVTDGPTVDEGVDVSAGVTSLVRHDLRLNPEHAVVVKLLSAPALLAHPSIPSRQSAAWQRDDWFGVSDQFIQANRAEGKLRKILFLARLLPLAELVGCTWLIWALGRRLFGRNAGLLGAGLWATTPFVVGIGHFVSIDVTFTLAALAVSLALLRFLEVRTSRAALWLGLAVGTALATRQSALVLLVVALVVVIVSLRSERRRAAEAVGIVVAASFGVVWALYRLVAPSAPGGRAGGQLRGAISASGSSISKLVGLLPLPLEWRGGFGYLQLTSNARSASLLGQSWTGTRWWYFPAVLAAKIPWGVLAAIAIGTWCIRSLDPDTRRRAWAAVAAPAVALVVFTMLQPLQLGVRLLLPSLALGLVLAGPVVAGLRTRPGRVALGLLAVTQIAAFGLALPHPLTWTPPPFTPNYRWVADSNIDYGQAEFELEDWSRGRRPFVAVANTRGLGRPAGSRDLLAADPADITGWVAVGVTPLMEIHRRELSWVRAYCRVGELGGGAILLYRFDGRPDTRAGPARPASRCPAGATRSTR